MIFTLFVFNKIKMYLHILQFVSGIIDVIAISYQRKYSKLHRSIYGLSYDLYLLGLMSSLLSVYCGLNYLWSPLIRIQLGKRYPLFYPLDSGKRIPLSKLLLFKEMLSVFSCGVVLRQLSIYRSTKHVHQNISKVCILVLFITLVFGTVTYAFSCSNLPIDSGKYGVFYVEHINYMWVIGNVLNALKFIPQFSLNWIGMSTTGLSSKFVLLTLVNKVFYLIFWFFIPYDESFEQIPFNITPFYVPFFECIFIFGILYQAQILYSGKKSYLPKGK